MSGLVKSISIAYTPFRGKSFVIKFQLSPLSLVLQAPAVAEPAYRILGLLIACSIVYTCAAPGA